MHKALAIFIPGALIVGAFVAAGFGSYRLAISLIAFAAIALVLLDLNRGVKR